MDRFDSYLPDLPEGNQNDHRQRQDGHGGQQHLNHTGDVGYGDGEGSSRLDQKVHTPATPVMGMLSYAPFCKCTHHLLPQGLTHSLTAVH